MTAYIIRRILLIIPTLILVTLVTTIAVRLVPGSVIDIKVSLLDFSNPEGMQQARDRFAHDLGLDVPIYLQYVRWWSDLLLHGSLGKSLWREMPVTPDVLARLPVTLELGILAIIIALFISFPIGIYSAIRQDSIGDYIARTFAILCISLPGFWVGIMVVVFPSIWWHWSPSIVNIPFAQDPIGNLKMYLLPAIILGTELQGVNMRMTRTMMLGVLRQDYIRTAWSKGLRERVIVIRHALKNALIPVVTIIGLQLPVVVGGSVIIEQIFCLPGMGRLLIESAFDRDYTTLVGITFVFTSAVLLLIVLTDLSYAYLDPRIHYK